MLISNYIENFPHGRYPSLITEGIAEKAGKLIPALGGISAGQFIIECPLTGDAAGGDFSVQITKQELPVFLSAAEQATLFLWRRRSEIWRVIHDFLLQWESDARFASIRDFWMEFDYGVMDADIPQPCCFFDAEKISVADATNGPLTTLLGEARAFALRGSLERCADVLSGVGTFQLGVMLAREENPRPARLFSDELTQEQVLSFLRKVNWYTPENQTYVAGFLDSISDVSNGRYIVDIGVLPEAVMDRMGLCIVPPPGGEHLCKFLDALENRGLATRQKASDVIRWTKNTDMPPFTNSISHFKFSTDGRSFGSKVYLQHITAPLRLILLNNTW